MASTKSRKSLFRRINNWLHLWLGLLSGVVVFVVCLTAAIWVFRMEFHYLLEPWSSVEFRDEPYRSPSELLEQSRSYLRDIPDDSLSVVYRIGYKKEGRSAYLAYTDREDGAYKVLFLNPYSGEVLHRQTASTGLDDFMMFLRAGHRFFWLPREIGSPFVGANCIVFLILLITGLVWWYPEKWTKSTREKSFKVKWNAGWKRVNLDLHNVLGFYSLIVAIILTVTGIVYSFRWFADGYRWLLTGGKPKTERPEPVLSDTTLTLKPLEESADFLWSEYRHQVETGTFELLSVNFPHHRRDPLTISLHPYEDAHSNVRSFQYDQASLRLLRGPELNAAKNLGEKIYEENFAIHVGTIGGLPTKILASIVSLIGASLPVTGFIIWYNRKWGKKKGSARKIPVPGSTGIQPRPRPIIRNDRERGNR